jgi:hypothetical protein
MRHQDRIYIQNANRCIRNKDHLNFSTSSDVCIFNRPTFTMTGADKIDSPTYVSDHDIHIIDTETTLDLTFTFTGSVESFITVGETFKYKIYKFDNATSVFVTIPSYESADLSFSGFSATSAFTDSILISDLSIDGEYLVKGSYDFTMCTEIMNNLGESVNTGVPLVGDQWGIYDSEFDFYFVALQQAVKPLFTLSPTDTRGLGALTVESFEMSGETQIETSSEWSGSIIVALNGLTLSEDDDFTVDGKIVTFIASIVDGDIVTVAYVSDGNPNGLLSESIIVDDAIVSGATGEEGDEVIYFNTGTSKYEIYMLADPIEFNDVIVTLNGVTLANGLDYTQSLTNPRRIVLAGVIYSSGDLGDGNIGALADIITITYNSYGTYAGTLLYDSFDLFWTLTPAPSDTNGSFTTLVAEDDTYSTVIFSAVTPYVKNQPNYEVSVDLSGYTGTTAIYKVTNRKDYQLVSGDTISTFTDSEEIAIEINI